MVNPVVQHRNVGRSLRVRLNRAIIPASRVLDRVRSLDDPIWVVGDGRSGTTWVANVINHDRSYRYLFEPFHPDFVVETAAFAKYQYLRPNDRSAHYIDSADRVFSGRLVNHRVDKLTRGWMFRGLLIKDIHTHLLLKWVDVVFPRVRKILLMRHPFAVASSKVARPEWSWVRDPSTLLTQPALRNDHLEPFTDVIEAARSEFVRHVVVWSIAHYVPLRQLESGRVLLMFYEEMRTDPDRQLRRVFDYLSDESTAAVSDGGSLRAVFDRASETSGEGAGRDHRRGVGDWTKAVSDADVEQGLSVLRAFGLDSIYNEQPMPNFEAAARLLARRSAPQ